MGAIASKSVLNEAQRGAAREITQMLQQGAGQVRSMLLTFAPASGAIDPRRREEVLVGVGRVVTRMFVGADGRRAYGDNEGADSLSPYARILSKWLTRVQAQQVMAHARYVIKQLERDPDILRWLQSAQVVARVGEAVRTPVFIPDPLAEYEAAHTWVDPRGYRLSDRIWQVSQRTRDKIDRVVSEGIRQGWSSMSIAEAVEGYLLPARQAVRTLRPYDLDASFDAMRLARTEIGRAHVAANVVASKANPYVDGMDWALSVRHPRVDVCDQHATLGMAGGRIKQPYPLGSMKLPFYDSHPQCLCFTVPAVSTIPAQVTAQLREEYWFGGGAPVTVVSARSLLLSMVGRRLLSEWVGLD